MRIIEKIDEFLNENKEEIAKLKAEYKNLAQQRDDYEKKYGNSNYKDIKKSKNSLASSPAQSYFKSLNDYKLSLRAIKEKISTLEGPKDKKPEDSMSPHEFANYALQKHENNVQKALDFIRKKRTTPQTILRNGEAWDILNKLKYQN